MKDFFDTVSERFRSPIFGNFIISWLVTNWQIPYVTFFVKEENLNTANKLEKIISIIDNYGSWLCQSFYLVVIPGVYTAIVIFFLPQLTYWAEKIRIDWNYKLTQHAESKSLDSIKNQNRRLTDDLKKLEEITGSELKHRIINGSNLTEIFIGEWTIKIITNNTQREEFHCKFKTNKFINSNGEEIFTCDNLQLDTRDPLPINFSAKVYIVLPHEGEKPFLFNIESRNRILLYTPGMDEKIIMTWETVNQ